MSELLKVINSKPTQDVKIDDFRSAVGPSFLVSADPTSFESIATRRRYVIYCGIVTEVWLDSNFKDDELSMAIEHSRSMFKDKIYGDMFVMVREAIHALKYERDADKTEEILEGLFNLVKPR
jgi:hypothetical protein